VEEQVDELGDLKVIDCDRWLLRGGVMIKPRCFVRSFSFTFQAEMP
jgi:hypothetical protein